MMLALIVSVVGFGGPVGERPSPLAGAWLAMPHHIARTNEGGKLRLTFQHRRRYRIHVLGAPCESVTARIDKRVTRVVLRCVLA